MRVLIHHKIEQVLDRASLWTKIMPQKIFSDLVHFIAENNGINLPAININASESEADEMRRSTNSLTTKSIDVGMESLLSPSKITKN